MPATADIPLLIAAILYGWELILIIAVVMILFGAKNLPAISRGIGRGIFEFRKASRDVRDEMDEAAEDAGRSVGGIYGKHAAQAITPDNQVAELYDPAAFRRRQGDELKARQRLIWKLKKLFARTLRFLLLRRRA